MHAGAVVCLRKVTGPQTWRVVMKVRKPAGDGTDQLDEQVFTSDKPCDLRAMYETVMGSVQDVVFDGELVRDASLEFFIGGRRRHPC